MPEQYGITSVPSTVPSKPPAFMASNRQSIKKEETRNNPKNSQGAPGPRASIQCTKGFNTRESLGERELWRELFSVDFAGRLQTAPKTPANKSCLHRLLS